jgi:endogenous inhibitor of DNA gyrase (YacG/DUF329 family)
MATKLCPICERLSAGDFHPFCSARCKEIDLHRWFGESYRVPVKEDDDEDGGVPNLMPSRKQAEE